jgi:hypothetical protein
MFSDDIGLTCYLEGVKGSMWDEVVQAALTEKIVLSKQHYEMHQRGALKHQIEARSTMPDYPPTPFFESKLDDYPRHVFDENIVRFFPANEKGCKSMDGWRWSKYLLTKERAEIKAPTGLVGENLRSQPFICLDIDGDHGDEIDEELLEWANQFKGTTEVWEARPTSYHIIFGVDRIIPTRHFPYAHIDILGNYTNQARFLKDKRAYGLRSCLTESIWEEIKCYVKERKSDYDRQAMEQLERE